MNIKILQDILTLPARKRAEIIVEYYNYQNDTLPKNNDSTSLDTNVIEELLSSFRTNKDKTIFNNYNKLNNKIIGFVRELHFRSVLFDRNWYEYLLIWFCNENNMNAIKHLEKKVVNSFYDMHIYYIGLKSFIHKKNFRDNIVAPLIEYYYTDFKKIVINLKNKNIETPNSIIQALENITIYEEEMYKMIEVLEEATEN